MEVFRIYHIRPKRGPFASPEQHGGATVLVEGNTNSAAVNVQVAFCRAAGNDPITGKPLRDTYNKKLGRQIAQHQPYQQIPLRQLPGFLGKLTREVYRRAKISHRYLDPRQFDARILDFLPKTLEAETELQVAVPHENAAA